MFQNLLKRIASRLDLAKIPYMIIGGQAVLLYGEPRLTKDIDITLGIGIDKLVQILNIVARLGFRVLVRKPDDFVKKTMVLPVVDKKSGIRIDFIFSFSPYEKQAIGRAKHIKLDRTAVSFASLEDVIIHKVVSGRARDIEDIKAIVLKNKKYNIRYINKWLKTFDKSLGENFSGIFKKVLKEIK